MVARAFELGVGFPASSHGFEFREQFACVFVCAFVFTCPRPRADPRSVIFGFKQCTRFCVHHVDTKTTST